ncbi:MAG: aminotransferase class V-fold PLP-dependent enzyme [Gemmatimonadetes bacterium]|nr:aminotransferase class V-fold PLP-dependent enzyme [Gemmatimonadota bacterium]
MSFPDRRRFLSHLLGGTAATLALPSWLEGASAEGVRGVPYGGGEPEDEAYWERVKAQFSIAPGLILMNAANLCPSPYPIQETVFRHTRDVNRDASFQNRGKFGELKEEARQALAQYVGASTTEIAITRNTSEGNNSVVNGLDLGPGDEVILWDQNHPTNNVSWDVRARRWGFSVQRVTTPPGTGDPGELYDAFVSALTDRTRVLSFSHLSNVSGIRLPAKQLCAVARERGILTLVDGAQTFGFLDLHLRDLGCDFFTGSSHKWFVGPKEAGLLFVRTESQDRLWPSDVGVGWEGAEANGAQKFENMGQRDDAAVVTMAAAAAFHEAIGPAAIEARVTALASALKDRLSESIPGVRFHTPRDPALAGGVVVVALPNGSHREIFEALYETHNLGCASMGGAFDGIRLSPHLYNTMEEVDIAVEAVAYHA